MPAKTTKAPIRKAASPQQKAPQPSKGLASLPGRVARIEAHVSALRAAVLPATVGQDAKPIIFTLAPGGPKVVRLTLILPDKTVLAPILLGSDAASSAPVANGIVINVFMELFGNPGDQASISVKNAQPSPLTSTIPAGQSQSHDVAEIKTQW